MACGRRGPGRGRSTWLCLRLYSLPAHLVVARECCSARIQVDSVSTCVGGISKQSVLVTGVHQLKPRPLTPCGPPKRRYPVCEFSHRSQSQRLLGGHGGSSHPSASFQLHSLSRDGLLIPPPRSPLPVSPSSPRSVPCLPSPHSSLVPAWPPQWEDKGSGFVPSRSSLPALCASTDCR